MSLTKVNVGIIGALFVLIALFVVLLITNFPGTQKSDLLASTSSDSVKGLGGKNLENEKEKFEYKDVDGKKLQSEIPKVTAGLDEEAQEQKEQKLTNRSQQELEVRKLELQLEIEKLRSAKQHQ